MAELQSVTIAGIPVATCTGSEHGFFLKAIKGLLFGVVKQYVSGMLCEHQNSFINRSWQFCGQQLLEFFRVQRKQRVETKL